VHAKGFTESQSGSLGSFQRFELLCPLSPAYLIAIPSNVNSFLLIIGREDILMENYYLLVALTHPSVFGQVSLERLFKLAFTLAHGLSKPTTR
jgi:hypothetical protein